MRVFLTGATGFVGSHLTPELVGAGHAVIGLSRSEAGDAALVRAGAEPFRGDLDDPAGLRAGVDRADAVVHAAFNHDFTRLKASSEADRRVILALGKALADSDRPLVVTSGTGLAVSQDGAPVRESDAAAPSSRVPRGATEEAADAVAARGGRVMVLRLPQVHDTRHQGRLALHVRAARRSGRVAYVGEGANRLSAVHICDAVRLYRLVLENGRAGARYHAVAEEGVAMRAIAEVIGERMRLPAVSIAPDEVAGEFGPIAGLVGQDLAASGTWTQADLGWTPSGPGLLDDLRATDFDAPA